MLFKVDNVTIFYIFIKAPQSIGCPLYGFTTSNKDTVYIKCNSKSIPVNIIPTILIMSKPSLSSSIEIKLRTLQMDF